jgi:hypothetical protein
MLYEVGCSSDEDESQIQGIRGSTRRLIECFDVCLSCFDQMGANGSLGSRCQSTSKNEAVSYFPCGSRNINHYHS